MIALDAIDVRILNALQKNGRLTNVELAEQVSLSASPCLRRVRLLEEAGIITGYRAQLDPACLGLGMSVFVDLRLSHHNDAASDEFEAAILRLNNVINCYLVSGSADYRLEVLVKDLQGYEVLLRQLQCLPHVKDIQSNFVIRSVKAQAPMPIAAS
ncbi:Transcriptional regulator, AsnC family [Nitrincola lacisaponensis]|uniref:Transcriptional regulator, AsnC family n=1 Tax=Nitrincola lacisaponensis TaxID=267850 RepID=A0A063Y2J0_9GAMM|nr:Lrp/AsnC family transcriptional regulator [Nitrincola lacisaponensis]KDE39385.1 Transcriptional regulator, AsnC family [Nitrincola lacisaponensis]